MLSGVPSTCFSLFSCCRESRQRVFLCFYAVGSPANVFFFVFVLSGVPPTCFSLFSCCRESRQRVFLCFHAVGSPSTCFSLFSCCREPRQRVFLCFHAVGNPVNVFFFVFMLSGTPPGCFFPYLYYRASHR